MKKKILLIIFILVVVFLNYNHYQIQLYQKETAVESFRNDINKPLPEIEFPEISQDEIEKGEEVYNPENPFYSSFEIDDFNDDLKDKVNVEENDEIIEEEIEKEDKDKDEEEEEKEEDEIVEEKEKVEKPKIVLRGTAGYYDRIMATLEYKGSVHMVSTGDKINGILVKDIRREEVVIVKEGYEFIIE